MDRLYVLRHGVAVPSGTPGIADDDRPLTPEGEHEVDRIAKRLKRLRLDAERIVTSPLPRARRTAVLIAQRLGLAGTLEDADVLRSGESAESIADWLAGRSERRLMIVGHDPAFSDLVGLLVTGSADPPLCELEKAGVAALRGRGDGRYLLDWLATPRLLLKRRRAE